MNPAYAEAHQAASAEAADALEQQEIPPAFRSHVRDYFDAIRPDRK